MDFRWHDLRHTSATRLIRATGNIQLVMRQLGLSQIQTASRYANQDIEDLRDAMELATATPKLRVVG